MLSSSVSHAWPDLVERQRKEVLGATLFGVIGALLECTVQLQMRARFRR